jgi:repressor LexA
VSGPIERLPGNERVTVPGFLLGAGRGDHYVLKVVGDSMADAHILGGDFAVIRRTQEWKPGEACVVVVGDEATIKRLYPGNREGTVILKPCDGSGGDQTFPTAAVKVQGVVVGIMRKY